ncbi:MAG: hypothetical protein ACX930_14555 [Erythrobacter sp.]
MDDTHKPPAMPELYSASLVATGIVYVAGVSIYSAIILALGYFDEPVQILPTLLGFFTIGLLGAFFAGFFLVAPLGTLFGLAVLKFSRPGWWQGPLTGALVTLALEGIVIGIVSREPLHWELGNAVILAWPVLLAMIAGWFVQRRMLNWPQRQA